MTERNLEAQLAAARAAAIQAIATLEAQQLALEDAGPAREAELAEISYAALIENDPRATQRVAEIHQASGIAQSEISSVAAALVGARRRLAGIEQEIQRVARVADAYN